MAYPLVKWPGPVWIKVLICAILNVLLVVALKIFESRAGFHVGIPAKGHLIGSILVAFLVVSRYHLAVRRHFECSNYIQIMTRETRELIQNMLVLSRRSKNTNQTSKEWRLEVAYRIMMLLRTSVAVLEYDRSGMAAWEVPELSGVELEYCKPSHSWQCHTDMVQSREMKSMRVPLLMAFLVRESIVSQADRLPNPMAAIHENRLLGSIDAFMNGYYGMQNFLTTPLPYFSMWLPHWIVLIFVFTLPLAFLGNNDAGVVVLKNNHWEHGGAIFLLTIVFLGLELKSMELMLQRDTGDTQTGMGVRGYRSGFLHSAQMVFEDTLMMVHESDGEAWADALSYRMHENVRDPLTPSELSHLLPNEDSTCQV